MTTETLDKLYLEWSQFTKAKTAREIALERALKDIVDFCDDPNGSESGISLEQGLSELLPAARAVLAKAATLSGTGA